VVSPWCRYAAVFVLFTGTQWQLCHDSESGPLGHWHDRHTRPGLSRKLSTKSAPTGKNGQVQLLAHASAAPEARGPQVCLANHPIGTFHEPKLPRRCGLTEYYSGLVVALYIY
jgi:hypothetical protein